MIQAFYKSKPERDTPYRELVLKYEDGWRVQLSAGTRWGRENADELKAIPVSSFEEGKTLFDKLFGELQNDGWRPYSPHEDW